jgi:hypothetical protein
MNGNARLPNAVFAALAVVALGPQMAVAVLDTAKLRLSMGCGNPRG